jgi:hypothetical protein
LPGAGRLWVDDFGPVLEFQAHPETAAKAVR